MDAKEFVEKVNLNWSKPKEEHANPEFIKYCDDFFENRAGTPFFGKGKLQLAEYIFYKGQIKFKKFYKEYSEGKDDYLKFDVENELVILYYDNEGWFDHNVMLITNENLYYWLSGGKNILDVGENTGKIPLENLKGKIQIAGWANHEIIINGNLLGGIDIYESKSSIKKLLQQFFDGISLNNEQYITKRSANISNQPQVVVQTNEPDIVTKIKQLNEFKEKGLISEEDFNSKKTELLDKM